MSDKEYRDLLYVEKDHVATITLNRPDRFNAIREGMYEEIIDALMHAGWNRDIGVIVLTGAGDRAFCTGGDQGDKGKGRYGTGTLGVPVEILHNAIRDAPKPVIAKVRGYAIGGGNVMATICDLTIACESAIFGQVAPRLAPSTRASARRIWRALSVKRRRVKSGICAAATALPKPWRWDW